MTTVETQDITATIQSEADRLRKNDRMSFTIGVALQDLSDEVWWIDMVRGQLASQRDSGFIHRNLIQLAALCVRMLEDLDFDQGT